MKLFTRTLTNSALSALFLFTSHLAFAQTAVVETVSSDGTISDFGADTLVIRAAKSPEPLRYTYTKTTTYVDETGAPVALTTVKSGLPVTVYYTKAGDQMIVSKVIVRKATTVAPAPSIVEEKKTTTTTTEVSK